MNNPGNFLNIYFYFCHESFGSWYKNFNFYFTAICQLLLTFYVCFYISVSRWLKLTIPNFVIILTTIVFARLFIIHLYVTNVNIKECLRFLSEHTQAKNFVTFRLLWTFTTALKMVAVFLLIHCDSCPCPALRKQ